MTASWMKGTLLACLLLGLVAHQASYASAQRLVDLRSNDIKYGPPRRPDKFTTKAQLNRYLSELMDYYTVVGRPRFGKRSGNSAGRTNEQHHSEFYGAVQRMNRPS